MADTPFATIRPAKAPEVVLVCEKCRRRMGPAGKTVRKGLKQALKTRRWGKVRLVETGCFSICPKRRQVLASPRSLGEHRVLVIEENASVEAALDYLLGPRNDGHAELTPPRPPMPFPRPCAGGPLSATAERFA